MINEDVFRSILISTRTYFNVVRCIFAAFVTPCRKYVPKYRPPLVKESGRCVNRRRPIHDAGLIYKGLRSGRVIAFFTVVPYVYIKPIGYQGILKLRSNSVKARQLK